MQCSTLCQGFRYASNKNKTNFTVSKGDPSWRQGTFCSWDEPEYKEFEDFLEDSEWGKTKELVYVTEDFFYLDLYTDQTSNYDKDGWQEQKEFVGATRDEHFHIIDLKNEISIRDFGTAFSSELPSGTVAKPVLNIIWLGAIKMGALAKIEESEY